MAFNRVQNPHQETKGGWFRGDVKQDAVMTAQEQKRMRDELRGFDKALSPRKMPQKPKPFLKWAGGKRQLLPELLLELPMPMKDARYFEPFLGGGALFFELRARGWNGFANLSDANEYLAPTYRGVRNSVDKVIAGLRKLAYDKEQYLALRSKMPNTPKGPPSEVAVWMIYMNRSCFNGLWRVNKAGVFNVPFGRYDNPTICDEPGLRAASMALRNATVNTLDFERIEPKKGDVVYFDPPYVPAGGSSDFTAYVKAGFKREDHERLRDFAARLKRRGVRVILTNADVPLVHELYRGFSIRRVEARRSINSKAGGRGPVGELIIT